MEPYKLTRSILKLPLNVIRLSISIIWLYALKKPFTASQKIKLRKLIKNMTPQTRRDYNNSIRVFLVKEITQLKKLSLNPIDLFALAKSINITTKSKKSKNQIFVDISGIVSHGLRTGIQRVTRSILRELLQNPPKNYIIEPVYANVKQCGYHYARKFTLSFLGFSTNIFDDEPISYHEGDIFFCLDYKPSIIPIQKPFYHKLRSQGVIVKFLVYDLLPIKMPHFFRYVKVKNYTEWLKTVLVSDGAICISASVARELKGWIRQNNAEILSKFDVEWSHLGADIENSNSTTGLPKNAKIILKRFCSKPSFLMVGTVEPRKGHTQTLSAFELLWNQGIDVNLVIVGEKGWLVEKLLKALRNHPKTGKLLFWLEKISDEYLEKIYQSCTCLIAPSEGEGFGLPLIEAARHKLPILARDLPIFREVAGKYAYYFKNDNSPEILAESIESWLELYASDNYPKSGKMPWLTWKESAELLFKTIINR